MTRLPKKKFMVRDYVNGILSSDKFILSKTITLVESTLPKDIKLAQEVLDKVLPHTGNSLRIGITGAPGVGKSTFIEALGNWVTKQKLKLAVLTVDPSSQYSKGSILGDKTRMGKLSHNALAYIRPSAAGSVLGGVGQKTRESILLCEAAGYEVIFVETVGVGQSETVVHDMVDFFLLLLLPGAGDELQGIKKGILEMADLLAINKAEGENESNALKTKHDFEQAFRLFQKAESNWQPLIVTCSALTEMGIADIWDYIQQYKSLTQLNGYFNRRRQQQNLSWLHELVRYNLEKSFYQNATVAQALPAIEQEVLQGRQAAISAARQLIEISEPFKRNDPTR